MKMIIVSNPHSSATVEGADIAHITFIPVLFPGISPGTGDFSRRMLRGITGLSFFLAAGINYGRYMVWLDAGAEWPGYFVI